MKTTSRPRMEVNLEELDQIIDGGMRAPLSESDGEKLKAVLHTLAERVKPRWRTTEKARAVLPQTPGSTPVAEKPSPEGESRGWGTAVHSSLCRAQTPRACKRQEQPQPRRQCTARGLARWARWVCHCRGGARKMLDRFHR